MLNVLAKIRAGVRRIEEEIRKGSGFSAGANMELKKIYKNKIKLIEDLISGYKHTQDRKQP